SLLAVPGASKYFMGGGVIYTHRARKRLVKIDFKDHPGVRSSSEPYASLLAGSVRELLSATWGLAETGAAGPTGNSYGDDAGHTCVAVAGPVTDVRTLETASSDREANMWAFTDEALELFIECLKRAP
ncbi:MAG: CinA family protein, partial [Pseudomonadota bacterium]|nr:CinA family protein [Pseudomonadota bacterium]